MFTLLGAQVSVTVELNPFNDVTTTVVVVLFPATVEVDAGFTLMLKLFTVKLYAALRTWLPIVPLTVTVYDPVAAVPSALTVNVDVALPFATGVTGDVLNEQVIFALLGVQLNPTADANPFSEFTVTVEVVLLPTTTVPDAGETPTV
jgi:hypothetical protein